VVRGGVRLALGSPILSLLLTITGASRSASHEPTPAPPVLIGYSHRQLLLVRAPSWSSSQGLLVRYEREETRQDWVQVGKQIAVNLGRHGLAWGRGLHPAPTNGPIKREGDGRSPAGAFSLGTAFGKAETLPPSAHGFAYRQATGDSYCVEDQRSELYTRLIDAREVTRTVWQKWSPLHRADGLFDWAILVEHNTSQPQVGAGSCVFLHIWRAAKVPTAGCTAMAEEAIEATLEWLRPEAQAVLVQLPEEALASLRIPWGLPGP
jgi:L,D-peptidoglycan transpeptidase YkuD (ErfK/YbiS/YcfS/YnhG family)